MNEKLKKSQSILIRIYDAELWRKYKIWTSKFAQTVNENKSKNEELCEFLNYYLDGQLSKNFYRFFSQQLSSTLNQAIFKRNFGLVNFLGNYLEKICTEIDLINAKLNWLLNSTITTEKWNNLKKEEKENKFQNVEDADWAIELKQQLNKKNREEFADFKKKIHKRDSNSGQTDESTFKNPD